MINETYSEHYEWFTKNYGWSTNKYEDVLKERKRSYKRNQKERKEKLEIIHTPPKKTPEELRIRPKFRRFELGGITLTTKADTDIFYESYISVENEGEIKISSILARDIWRELDEFPKLTPSILRR